MTKRIENSDVVSVIPFHIELRALYRGSEQTEHELSFGVVGIDEPAKVIVSSELYSEPAIIEREGRGGLELSDSLLDGLAIAFFKLMAGLIIDQNGDSGWWTLADVSAFVTRQFQPDNANLVLRELARHVTPGLTVTSTCLVADDDNI